MDVAMRKAIEERAYVLWEEAGRPDGSGLLYWLRAEEEFGIIPKVEDPDPLVTLRELAVEAQQQHEEDVARAAGNLQESVDEAYPWPNASHAGRRRILSVSMWRRSPKRAMPVRASQLLKVASACRVSAAGRGRARRPPVPQFALASASAIVADGQGAPARGDNGSSGP